MANHAYVIPKKMPTRKQIDTDAREIVTRKFPMFDLHYDGKKNWHLQYKDDGYIGLIFWIDKYGLIETWTPETEECKVYRPCIEFRHGHSRPFMWWVEYEIREELALRYKAQCADDGTPGYDPPQTDRYNSYMEYLVRTRWDMLAEDDKWRDFLNMELESSRAGLPQELLPLIGENIPKNFLHQFDPATSGWEKGKKPNKKSNRGKK